MKKLIMRSWHVRKKTQNGIVHLIDDRIPKEIIDKMLKEIPGEAKWIPAKHLVVIKESVIPVDTKSDSKVKTDSDADSV